MNLDCLLDYGNGTISCAVVIRQSPDGAITASVKPFTAIGSTLKGNCYLDGVPGGRWVLTRTEAYVAGRKVTSDHVDELVVNIVRAELVAPHALTASDLVTIRIGLTNLPFKHLWNEHFILNVGGYSIAVSYRRRGSVTHVAEITGARYGDLARIKELMQEVCWLLSLATGRLVGVARVDVLSKRRKVYTELDGVMTSLNQGLPLVLYEMSRPPGIAQFIEHSLPHFQRESRWLPLQNLINIGLLAKHSFYVENQVLLMTNCLEVLRYSYALNVGVPAGFMRQRGSNFDWLPGSGNTGQASFAAILEHFFASANISGWTPNFTKLRNEIVHTGQIAGSFADQVQQSYDLHHLCDRILLAILNWDHVAGHYLPFNDRQHPDPNRGGNNWTAFSR